MGRKKDKLTVESLPSYVK